MTLDEMKALFEKYSEESNRGFEDVAHKFSTRPDIHVFILLNDLLPGRHDMVDCAEHDEIWLDVDVDQLAGVITEQQIADLVACGFHFDTDVERIHSFV
jgi:hypothetical protein